MAEVDTVDKALQLLSAFFFFFFESLPLSSFVTWRMCVEKTREKGAKKDKLL